VPRGLEGSMRVMAKIFKLLEILGWEWGLGVKGAVDC
jgi:hypothetical protein